MTVDGGVRGRSLGRDRWARLALLLCSAVFTSAACVASGSEARLARGQTVEVLAVWTGVEQQHFARVVADFHARTGVSVTYTSASAGVADALARRVAAGRPPDIAFLPQPGALRQYAARGLLVPLDRVATAAVARNYSPVWRDLGSFGGHLYGVWFKAANKSLIWYNVGAFERAGVVPPDNVDRLATVAQTISASGLPAFAVGGGDRWTLTDWFENLYLRVAGPVLYDLLADHRLAWTDQSVKDTLGLLSRLLAPSLVAGGTRGALATTFPESVRQVFGQPPAAAMTSEGDFVAGFVTADTPAALGVDADVFAFPAVGPSGPAVVAGGDVAVLLRQSRAGTALLRYLATPEAAAVWAAQGGFISPNVNLDLSVYPDDITRSEARRLLDAGDSLRFDLSDLQPPVFGSTPSAGMQKALAEFLTTRDVDGTATELEAAATAAYGR